MFLCLRTLKTGAYPQILMFFGENFILCVCGRVSIHSFVSFVLCAKTLSGDCATLIKNKLKLVR